MTYATAIASATVPTTQHSAAFHLGVQDGWAEMGSTSDGVEASIRKNLDRLGERRDSTFGVDYACGFRQVHLDYAELEDQVGLHEFDDAGNWVN